MHVERDSLDLGEIGPQPREHLVHAAALTLGLERNIDAAVIDRGIAAAESLAQAQGDERAKCECLAHRIALHRAIGETDRESAATAALLDKAERHGFADWRAEARAFGSFGSGCAAAWAAPAESGCESLLPSRYTAIALSPSRHDSLWMRSTSATVASAGMLMVLEMAPERNGCTAAIIRTWPIGSM